MNSPQIPNVAAIASAIVFLANMFFGSSLVEEQVREIIGAILVLLLAGSSVWSWFKTRGLVAKNIELSASLSAAVSAAKAKK
jgi:hypothetical protein